MFNKRTVSLFLCAALALALIFALPVSGARAGSATYQAEWYFGAENQSNKTMYYGTLVEAFEAAYATSNEGNECHIKLLADVTTDGELYIEADGYATLDLNGHGITRKLSSSQDNGYVIGNTGVLTITDKSSNVVSEQGKITGGNTTGDGGGIFNNGMLIIKGGNITGNKAAGNGGGIFSSNELKMYGGSITGNTATNNGGGIYCISTETSSYSYDSTVVLSGGSITGNTATNGGGIYNDRKVKEPSIVTLSGGSITGNNASIDGGGIYNKDTLTVENGSITGNTAGFGGGIYNNTNAMLSITGGAIGGEYVDDKGNKITGNKVVGNGGGVYDDGTLTMTGGSITGNAAIGNPDIVVTQEGFGGGVYVATNGTFTFDSAGGLIDGNQAHTGGGVYVFLDGTLTISGGTISGNTATESGGGGVYNYGELKIVPGESKSVNIKENNASQNGGGIYNNNEFAISGDATSITGNTATRNGGGVYNDATFMLNGGTIENNTALYGGGVYNDDTMTMTDGSITGNSTEYGDGGGVRNRATFTMQGGVIKNNSIGRNVYGGGVYSDGTFNVSGNASVLNNKKILNTTEVIDNNVYLSTGNAITVTGALTGTTPQFGVTTEIAPTSGNSVAIVSCATGVTVSKDSFQSDSTAYYTAQSSETTLSLALSEAEWYFGASVANTTRGTVFDAIAAANTSSSGNVCHIKLLSDVNTNGDLQLYDGVTTLDLNGYTINRGLIAPPDGANGSVIINDGNLTIEDNSNTDVMKQGKITGGYSNAEGGGINNAGTLTIKGGNITGNIANIGGGGICNGKTLTVKGGSITGNTSPLGGGVYSYADSTVNIEGGTITGNTATEFGGGVYSTGTLNVSGNAKVIDNKITGTETASNVYLPSKNDTVGDKIISVTGALGENASIGVTKEIPEGESRVRVAKPVTDGINDDTKFSSDTGYTVSIDIDLDEEVFFVDKPEAEWYFGAENQTNPKMYYGTLADAFTWVSDIDAFSGLHLHVALLRDVDEDTNTSVSLASGETATLDLKGYTIDRGLSGAANIGFVLANSGNLTIIDTSNAKSGTITGGNASGEGGVYGGGICNSREPGTTSSATLTIKGGCITGNKSPLGGGVYNDAYSTVNIEGGTITGNTATEFGGGVYSAGTLNMTGGVISNNIADDENTNIESRIGNGGGVYNIGMMTLEKDGKIINNTAAKEGGGIKNGDGQHNQLPSLTISGGEISGNKATYSVGGGVANYVILSVSGGKINNNTSGMDGGGVYSRRTDDLYPYVSLTMTGGKIQNNKAIPADTVAGFGRGGGVFCGTNISMSGDVTITGNVGRPNPAETTTGANNLYLADRIVNDKNVMSLINVTGALTGNIGVTTEMKPVSGTPTVFTTHADNVTVNSAVFASDESYAIRMNEKGNAELIVAPEAEWYFGNDEANTTQGSLIEAFTAARVQSDENNVCHIKLLDNVYTKQYVHNAETDGYCVIQLDEDKYATLDLNGFSIDRGLGADDAVAAQNGRVLENWGTLTITDGSAGKTGKITGGYNSNVGGGGIYNNGTLTIEGGSVTGNRASTRAGGIFNKGTLTITGGSITNNTAEKEYGGGILNNDAGTLNIYSDSPANPVLISDNTASYGGGIANYAGGVVNIGANVVIEKNKATTHGGGIHNQGEMTVGAVTIRENIAISGGGVYIDDGAVLKVSGDVKVTGNTYNGAANNLYLYSNKTITVTGALGANADIGVTTGKSPKNGSPVAITTHADGVTVDATKFTSDAGFGVRKGMTGDAELIFKPEAEWTIGTVTTQGALTEAFAAANSDANTDGATIALLMSVNTSKLTEPLTLNEGKTAILDLVDFAIDRGLTAETMQIGGSVIENKGALTIRSTDKDGNPGTNGIITGGYTEGHGGGIDNSGTLTLESGTITGNGAPQASGGGIYNTGSLILAGGTITGNTANTGAGICNVGEMTSRGETRVVISQNTAAAYNNAPGMGGGIMNEGQNVSSLGANVSIQANTAFTGGGLFNDGENLLTLDGAVVSANEANYGGGVLNQGVLNIKGSVTGNTAVKNADGNNGYGGGVYNLGTLNLSDEGSVTNNTAEGYGGGGVYNNEKLTVTGVVTGNEAAEDGGGVYNGGTLEVSGSARISGNTLTGAAQPENNVYMPDSSCLVTVTGALGADASIGVTTDTLPTSGAPVVITAHASGVTVDDAKFKSDAGYPIRKNAAGDAEMIASAEAEWTIGTVTTQGALTEAFAAANGATAATRIKLLLSVNTTAALTLNQGKEATLDLNGKAIDRGLTAAADNGGVIVNNGNLTIADSSAGQTGAITGGFTKGNGGGVQNNGTLTVTGGNIVNNRTAGNGGGVYHAGAALKVSGRAIINNNARDGGTEGLPTNNNVYLPEGKLITVAGELDTETEIGVTAQKAPISGAPVPVATPSDDVTYGFLSDDNRYHITVDDEAVKLYLPDVQWYVGDDPLPYNGTLADAFSAAGNTTETVSVRLTAEVNTDAELTLPSGGKLLLDLNGMNINRGLTAATDDGAVIVNNGNLTISDTGTGSKGKITGGFNKNLAGGVVNNGALTLAGGVIAGNTGDWGGGVYNGNGATLNMTGGAIQDNTATTGGGVFNVGALSMTNGEILGNAATEDGGGVYATGKVSMSGGKIHLNEAANGGGVFLCDGVALEASGAASVSDNTDTADKPNNLFLGLNDRFTVTGALTGKMAVTLEEAPEKGNPAIVAVPKDASVPALNPALFVSDAGYPARLNSNGGVEFYLFDFAISLAPEALEFGMVRIGYAAQTAQTVTVTNAGNQPTGKLTVALDPSNAFTLSATELDSIDAGKTATFTVVPKDGLAEGVYLAHVIISGGSVPMQHITAAFAVVRVEIDPDPSENNIAGIITEYVHGDTVTFTANGGGENSKTPIEGDKCYTGLSWTCNPAGDFKTGATQSFPTADMTLGTHTLTVTFIKQVYNGTAWVNIEPEITDKKSTSFTLKAAPIDIETEPEDAYVVVGQAATFRVKAKGANLTYQWFINRNDARGWQTLPGATNDAYTTAPVTLMNNGYQYYCRITDKDGHVTFSKTAILHVALKPVPPITGDNSNPALLIAVCALALLGAAVIVGRKKRA